MLDPSHPLHASIVRIRDEHGTIHGGGFLAAPRFVCTCAHVIADALHIPRETEQPPDQEVRLDFPFLGGAEVTARIQVWVRMEPNEGGGDIAVLRLVTAQPSAARPVRLLPVGHLSGRAFEAYGFPSTTDVGQYAYGILRDRLANGYVQLEGTTTQGYRIQRGYSGTPVWDQRGRGVVGMVVAEDRAPEAKVAFLIPNTLIFYACPDIKPITLHQLFAPLTDGLVGLPGSPLNGVEQFLREYLGTPEIPAPFGGRQVQLAALDRWLVTPTQPYALLVAEAGRGKSALLAHWATRVADERRAEVVLVPISIRFSTSLKSTTVNLLGARLHHLHSVRADLPRDAEAWLAEIELYLREDRPVGPPLLIVLDGADEAADWLVGRDLRFPTEPGRGIKVLVSARPLVDCDVAGWVRRLEWQGVAVPMELPLLDRSGVAEVLRSMGDPLAGLARQVDAVGELHRLSEGDPLLLRLYVDALRGTGERAAFLTAEDLGHLKPGLQAYFDQWWDDQRRQWGTAVLSKEPAVRTLLNLLACALGPLSTDDLLALMEPEQVDLWILEEALRPLARFVVGDSEEQSYTFSHPRLNQYFYEKLPPRERQAWEQRFMSYGSRMLAALTSSQQDPHEVSHYLVRYYGAHLERGSAHPDLFDELVSEGWLRAWEALEGAYDGFLRDLARVWKRAEAAGAQAQNTQERGRAIGRQCRYALIVASIKSLAGNIPPALLAALVDKGVWTPIQGLAFARQIPSERELAQTLAGLAPYLSESLQETALQEALVAARAIEHEGSRVQALADLAPHLSESLQETVLQEALAVARAIADEESRAQVLADLTPHLSEPLLQEALAAVRAIADEESRVQALADLTPHLSEPLLQEALAVARAIEDEGSRVQALADLAPYLSEPLQETVLQEVLAVVRAIADEFWRAWALASLWPHLSESLQETVLQEALAAARAIADEYSRAQVLASLVPHLGELGYEEEALATARAIAPGYSRARALADLTPHLSEPLLQEALAAVRATEHEGNRAQVLADLVPHLGELGYEEEALAAARAIEHERSRARALAGLAPHLSEPLLQEALAAARAIEHEGSRAQVLASLVPHLGELGYEEEALAVARAIEDEESRVQALAGLAPHLSEPLLQEALAAARAIADEYSRVQALADLAPHLSEPLLQEALAAVRAIADEGRRAQVLADLVPHLGELGYEEEALAVARAIEDGESRARALASLWPHLSESLQETVLQEALAAARAIEHEGSRAQVLADLVPHLGELGYEEEALAAARAIAPGYSRARALASLAPHLSEPLLQEALAAARAIADEGSRAQALASLVPHLSEPLQETVLAAARAIADEYSRVRALVSLVPHLSESLQETVLQEALAVARAIEHEGSRVQALAGLAPHLSEPLQETVLQEALAVARAIEHEESRARALASLVPHLGELGYKEAALAVARAIEHEGSRAQALASLVPHLSESLLQEALAAARAIADEGSRARALASLAPHLSEPLLQEALAAARAIEHEGSRVRALASLAPHLSEPLQETVLQEALAVARAIEDEGSRVQALAGLAPHLSEPLLQEALAAARAIADEYSRVQALADLAPHLSEPLLQEALAAVRAIADEGSRAQVLADLVPHLGELGYEEEALAAARAIEDGKSRVQALADLAPHLSEPLQETVLQEALAVARAIAPGYSRARALASLVPHVKHLPVVRLYALWCETLRILATRTRSDLLSDIQALASVIAVLGGKEALVATAQAIIEVGKWFP